MDLDAANKLGERLQITQGQQNREKSSADGAGFFDTINAKASESRETTRFRRRNDKWIEQIRRRRIEMEQQAWRARHEEYVKMLKASSLKRSLQESENRRYTVSSVARDVALSAYGIEYQKKYGGFF